MATRLAVIAALLACEGTIGNPSADPRDPLTPDPPLSPELAEPVFQLEPEGDRLQPGIRGLTHTELARSIFDVTGVEADVSELPANSEEYHLGNDADSLTYRDGAALRTLLRIATDVAAAADIGRLLPCAGTCTDGELRAYLEVAFAQPLSGEELARYRDIYDRARTALNGEEARRAIVQASLMSPSFLYRTEIGDGGRSLTATELAKKLSYFAWGRPPDAELRAVAFDGSLLEESVYEGQVDRVLADERTRERMVEFIFDWMGLDHFDLQSKVLASELPPEVEASMVEEAVRMIGTELFDEARGLRSLFTTETTFMDEMLADVYGVEGVTGGFQEVSLAGTGRRGILTTPLVLSAHAKEMGRSPMQRGHFLVAELMCLGFGPEFGEVTAQLPEDPGDETFREQFANLQVVEPCNNCHRTLNAGFAFDIYDNVGRRYAADFVPDEEAAGVFNALPYDPVEFDNPSEAALGLSEHPLLTRCFVGQTYRFAQGSRSVDGDAELLGELETAFDESAGDVLALFRSIALSERFAAAVRE
ncbi:MAG: DUF1592 domain-containing protein [Myxococcota bacterium]